MDRDHRADKWSDAWRQASDARSMSAMTTSLGWDLALPIFGGALLGHLLDRRLDTSYAFTLGLLVLGIFTGFYNVMRSIQRVDARERQRARQENKASETSGDMYEGESTVGETK